MKAQLCIIAALFTLFAACSKDPLTGIKSNTGITLKQSLAKWQAYKASVNNSYSYVVSTSSWVGTNTQITVTVQNGIIIARDYKRTVNIASMPNIPVITWHEDAATINTHPDIAPGITIDDIYTQAATNWLKADSKANAIYFETNNNDGIISTCGYFPNNCADDCFIGIDISNITKI